MPQVLINVPSPVGFQLQHHEPLRAALQALERELQGQGRTLIRPSGTEPVVRVMVEHPDEAKAQAYAQRLAASIS
ncbi:MAG: hypothetical protein EBV68_09845 [Betaproteobacteria bacterium]|nr:hypothetical protein [Betaproteobacteria bacterium]